MSDYSKMIRIMVFMAMYAAMAVVLDFVKELIPFTSIWANGGSIDISLIPLVFASVHLGYKLGVLTALLQFAVSIVLGTQRLYFAPYSPIIGFLCDYIIPIVIMGFASLLMKKKDSYRRSMINLEIGIFVCMAIRMFSQVISGVYCWVDASDLGSLAAWVFSLRYNLGYGIPTLVCLLIVMPLICKLFERQLKKDI